MLTTCNALNKSRGVGKPVGMTDKEGPAMFPEATEHYKLLTKMLESARTHK